VGPGSLLHIPFGFTECLKALLQRRLEETGDLGCRIPGTENPEKNIEFLPEFLPIYSAPESNVVQAELCTGGAAPGDPGAKSTARV